VRDRVIRVTPVSHRGEKITNDISLISHLFLLYSNENKSREFCSYFSCKSDSSPKIVILSFNHPQLVPNLYEFLSSVEHTHTHTHTQTH